MKLIYIPNKEAELGDIRLVVGVVYRYASEPGIYRTTGLEAMGYVVEDDDDEDSFYTDMDLIGQRKRALREQKQWAKMMTLNEKL